MTSLMGIPLPSDEPERLDSLHAYAILDTPPDPRFDAITQLAALLFNAPMALVSLIDETRQWFKSTVGPVPSGGETDRSLSFCAYALLSPTQILVVQDATKDPRFAKNVLVTGVPGIRFYAGAPIIGTEGHALGTLCVLDTVPRQFSSVEQEILRNLALAVLSALDLHRSLYALRESEENHRQTVELSPQIPWTADPLGMITEAGPRWLSTTGLSRDQALGLGWIQALHPDDVAETKRSWAQALQQGQPVDIEYRLRTRESTFRWFRAYAAPRRGADGNILRWYGTVEDIHERKLSQARVEHMAYHDSLTGLPGRVRFRDRLEQEIARAGRGASFALLSLDIDNFKAINDTRGHHCGDALLCQVADRLRASVRECDFIARVGGDEFLMIATDLKQPEEAALLAERVLTTLDAAMQLDGHFVAVGASIGIAICPRDGTYPDKLLQSADLALYRAKGEGRRAYRFFVPEMDEKVQRLHALTIDLRAAMERDELDLAYQPLVGLLSGRVEGFEALLRWNHPLRGAVPPDEFVPVAESTGLILPIGRWALEQACSEARRWPNTVRVAVNLSSIQFGQRDLPQAVHAALAASGLPPERLELEITESVPLLDDETNLSILHRLREMGIQIALDDFGTGYASLGYLQRFPFSKIKIDRSFVSRIAEAEDARTIVQTILAMSRALGITVTAEGVETREQLEFLRAHGCDQVQGYLFGRPTVAADVPTVIEMRNRSPQNA